MTRKNNRVPFIVLAAVCSYATTAHADWAAQVIGWLRLDRTPSEMRAPSDAPQNGDIFTVTLDGGEPLAVTSGGGFRSPVFLSDGKTLLALRGDDLISVLSSGGSPQILYTVHEAIKLLGISSENNNQLLLLLKRTEGGFELGELELNSGQVKRLPSDTPDNPDHRLMLRYLRGDDRKYDGISVYIQTESKARLGGKTEWTDIYIKQGDKPATNISRCAGYNCSQPSISFDRSRVAFIRSNEQY